MAGHSKWHNIQHRKGAQDKKRAKIFTKLIHELTVAAKGGDDLSSNPKLRLAVEKAKSENMPKDTIKRAIERGAGGNDDNSMQEVRYEGYGPNGVAIIADCLTDNRNRTAAEVRHAFTKHGGNLGTSGSVAYLFNQKGIITLTNVAEEDIMEIALENGAEDIITNDDESISIFTTPDNLEDIKNAFNKNGRVPESAESTYIADINTNLDFEHAEKLLRLLQKLEDCDDVQDIYHNADISDDIMKKLNEK
tara:strand:- start:42 stop:788 length:747 start_codon:yes stop_codon:yes gene_type:complete